jgi:hypothetical protein
VGALASDESYLVAITMHQMAADGDPWDPGFGLYLGPENPETVPIGLDVRQARTLAEGMLRLVEQAEATMTELCQEEGCDGRTVPNAAGLCDHCRLEAWSARRPRLVT